MKSVDVLTMEKNTSRKVQTDRHLTLLYLTLCTAESDDKHRTYQIVLTWYY